MTPMPSPKSAAATAPWAGEPISIIAAQPSVRKTPPSAIGKRTGIASEANIPAARLGLLQRKRLEIARDLATRPALLLLDEVAGGLTDPEVTVLVEIVRGINAEGTTVIWIEHVVRALTSLVSRLLCLYGGQFIGDGDPASVLADPKVREIYLGSDINIPAGMAALDQEDTLS